MEELNIKGFSFVNLELSNYEIKLFDIINIINDLDYNRFGNLKLLKKELIDYFKKVCNNDITLIKEVVNIICRIIDKNIKKLNKETGWITIRSSLPNDEFDIPRWHMDGCYFEPFNENNIKFIFVLKGPQTLLYDDNQKIRNLVKNNEDRDFLSNNINLENSIKINKGYGVLFITGDNNIAAIHSEPPIKEQRLFISIVFGSQEQINNLDLRWNSK
jgi:hypothetical protein